MAARDLFRFRFEATLGPDQARRLADATGMLINGVDEGKEMPGSGFFGPQRGRVMLTLSRVAGERWELEAFTHQPDGCDLDAIAACRARLLALLPEIAVDWQELPVES